MTLAIVRSLVEGFGSRGVGEGQANSSWLKRNLVQILVLAVIHLRVNIRSMNPRYHSQRSQLR